MLFFVCWVLFFSFLVNLIVFILSLLLIKCHCHHYSNKIHFVHSLTIKVTFKNNFHSHHDVHHGFPCSLFSIVIFIVTFLIHFIATFSNCYSIQYTIQHCDFHCCLPNRLLSYILKLLFYLIYYSSLWFSLCFFNPFLSLVHSQTFILSILFILMIAVFIKLVNFIIVPLHPSVFHIILYFLLGVSLSFSIYFLFLLTCRCCTAKNNFSNVSRILTLINRSVLNLFNLRRPECIT